MGHLKHVFGDDMTPDEKARLDHAELVEVANAHGQCLTSRALWKHHDRKYGVRTLCAWCNEPALDRIADAFARPCVEPTRSGPAPRPAVSAEIASSILRTLRDNGINPDAIGIVVRTGTLDASVNFNRNAETENRDDHNV